MHIARYRDRRTAQVSVGLVRDGRRTALTGCASLSQLLAMPLDEIKARCSNAVDGAGATGRADDVGTLDDTDAVDLLAPIDGLTEVWASGVTYLWSREARAAESAGFASAYQQVYDAARPELFFKSLAWRVSGPGASISVRADSTIDVPEPELALVVNAHREVVGYCVCNDVSSRSIEGENPLYLPQAKVYLGSCALGPMIRPAWEIADPYQLAISARIVRDGETVWHGDANTSQLNRRFDDLLEYLFRADDFPAGVVLSTGTCLVPALPFSLEVGDVVRIEIDAVGVLINTVVRGKAAMRPLVGATSVDGALRLPAGDAEPHDPVT